MRKFRSSLWKLDIKQKFIEPFYFIWKKKDLSQLSILAAGRLSAGFSTQLRECSENQTRVWQARLTQRVMVNGVRLGGSKQNTTLR